MFVADTSAFRSAFNGAAKVFGGWLARKRFGRNEDMRADILARIAIFPGGEELLRQAAELGCDIIVRSKRDVGAEGAYDNNGAKPVIYIANTGNAAGMAVALWHELRHMKQDAANPGAGFASGGQLRDPRTAYLMGVMIEADAFTAETLMAMQQRKAGRPEYAEAMFGRYLSDGPHLEIARFLKHRPYESFKDDAGFARALFTHLMTEGLVAYRAQYMARLGRHFALSENVEQFRARIAAEKAGGTNSTPGLNALYGPGFMSVSPRALATAFLPAQGVDEQQLLDRADKTVKRAATLTEAQFQEAKTDILRGTQEFWFKPLDEPQYVRREELQERDALRKAAQGETPPPRIRR